MILFLSLGIFIGVICGLAIEKYIFPYFDIQLEKLTYRESVTCTKHQTEAQKIAKKFEVEYGEVPELSQAIGFQTYDSDEFEEYEDESEDNKTKESKIGFKLEH